MRTATIVDTKQKGSKRYLIDIVDSNASVGAITLCAHTRSYTTCDLRNGTFSVSWPGAIATVDEIIQL